LSSRWMATQRPSLQATLWSMYWTACTRTSKAHSACQHSAITLHVCTATYRVHQCCGCLPLGYAMSVRQQVSEACSRKVSTAVSSPRVCRQQTQSMCVSCLAGVFDFATNFATIVP
jgi:hypothetical protein